ncbi:FOG: WD40 repeat [Hahella chejuensis KCTC 2396]|uniref:FOG: WD40 repeat n=1 Tax=Hahella chejuensis (strain KCTC 2396) TaxID=349521 RepID=Q2SAS7_HAHCH|nr:2OG-Fe(II) oxygenase [Hahella chejuensis]ABC32247.1 FOG: WD40 repeat [Hahella chejuensis KCTC 2396]
MKSVSRFNTSQHPPEGVQRIDLAPELKKECFVLRGVFSEIFCEQLLASAITRGFSPADAKYPPSYRNNARQVVDDPMLARRLFEVCGQLLPQSLPDAANSPAWSLHSLNPRLRLCRYSAGQSFFPHQDGVYACPDRSESKLTFLLYLNDATEFSGGDTLFFKDASAAEISARFTPRRGDLIVFDHSLWHSGDTVLSGEKYILRSDLIYRPSRSIGSIPALLNPHVLHAHNGYIWKVATLSGGRFATASRDKTIRIWSPQKQLLQTLSRHANSVLDLCSNAKDDLFAVSRDGTLSKWEQRETSYFPVRKINTFCPTPLHVSPLDENQIVTTGSDGVIRLWSHDLEPQGTLTGRQGWVWDIASLGQGNAVSGGEDGSLSFWRIDAREHCFRLSPNTGPIRCLALSDKARSVFAGTGTGHILHIDLLPEPYVRNIWKAHNGIVRSLFVEGENQLISGGEDCLIRYWSLAGEALKEDVSHENFVTSLCAYRDKEFLSASYDGRVTFHSL